jgi:hypothetical protein
VVRRKIHRRYNEAAGRLFQDTKNRKPPIAPQQSDHQPAKASGLMRAIVPTVAMSSDASAAIRDLPLNLNKRATFVRAIQATLQSAPLQARRCVEYLRPGQAAKLSGMLAVSKGCYRKNSGDELLHRPALREISKASIINLPARR